MLTNGSHTLKSFHSDWSNHCILFKLTDTSAKYIQEFITRKDSNKKASFKLSKGTGEIIFSNSQPKDPKKSFKFGVSSITGSTRDSTVSFECASYKNKKFQSLNTIKEKIIVQGTDDAFQVTKQKLLSVNKEKKKNLPIEFDPIYYKFNRIIPDEINQNQRKRKRNESVENVDKPAKRLQKSKKNERKEPININNSLSSSSSSSSST